MGTEHGYVPYTHGCRCAVCRKAKADYMRERRAAARELARRYTDPRTPRHIWDDGAKRHLADLETHGTVFGYQERGCRCAPCTRANNDKRAAERKRQIDRQGVTS